MRLFILDLYDGHQAVTFTGEDDALRDRLCEDVGFLLVGGDVGEYNMAGSNAFTNKVVTNVNVLGALMKRVIFG